MFVRKKKNRSGSVSVAVVDKSKGRFREIRQFGVAHNAAEVEALVSQAQRGQGDRHRQDHNHHRHKDRWDGRDRATYFVPHQRASNHQATLRP